MPGGICSFCCYCTIVVIYLLSIETECGVIELIDIHEWMRVFMNALETVFGDRIWFAGLQGSYGRDEATDNSDIDVVVILDALSGEDIKKYQVVLDTLPHRELICGFLSGKEELMHWDPADLFQFYYDTKPIVGSLDVLLPLIDAAAVARAIKMGAGNIYHGCVHNMLHEHSNETLIGLYKTAAFVVQAIVYRQAGTYISKQEELVETAGAEEREILETFACLKSGGAVDFDTMSNRLFAWSKMWIRKTDV